MFFMKFSKQCSFLFSIRTTTLIFFFSIDRHCCTVFVRPTDANIRHISDEIGGTPKYGEYHVCKPQKASLFTSIQTNFNFIFFQKNIKNYTKVFSNIVKNSQLEELANNDLHEVVRQVQEYFADVHALQVSCGVRFDFALATRTA